MISRRTDELEVGDAVEYDLGRPKNIRVVERLQHDGMTVHIVWRGKYPDSHVHRTRLWILPPNQPNLTRRSATT